ncbi:MAG: DEAD/DEAH box helicase family protein [archaeon]|nr:DEAD/DEAH box helicase family protein [archaeon]
MRSTINKAPAPSAKRNSTGGEGDQDTKRYPFPIDTDKKNEQHTVRIKDKYDIIFPYEPYDCQLSYMEKIIECLEEGNKGFTSTAALESPTGTGKTLCLLCACLGWLNHKRLTEESNIKIFYTTRTHTQITNVIKELKKTCYKPKMTLLSSRDNSCINNNYNESKGQALNIKCRFHKKTCPYYLGSDRYDLTGELFDIEELKQRGLRNMFCPYYTQSDNIKNSDIIFLPYNYIFDGHIRESMRIKINNDIVIFDEAHNISKVAEDASSYVLDEKNLGEMIKELSEVMKQQDSDALRNKDTKLRKIPKESIKAEREIILNIISYLKKIKVKQGQTYPDKGKLLSNEEILQVFFKGSESQNSTFDSMDFLKFEDSPNLMKTITPENISEHIKLLKDIVSGILDMKDGNGFSKLDDFLKILQFINEFKKSMDITKGKKIEIRREIKYESEESSEITSEDTGETNPEWHKRFINSFRFFLSDEGGKFGKKNSSNDSNMLRTLNIFCLNPGLNFGKLKSMKPYSIILTSGTLSPLSGLKSELNNTFNVTLENHHVIQESQIHFSIISSSTYGMKNPINYSFTYDKRNDTAMIGELGYNITELSKVTPGGILVFFSSYAFMNSCYKYWNDNGIIRKLAEIKEIIKDDPKANKGLVEKYIEANKKKRNIFYTKTGGIFFSVCRGSSSEGLDFSDNFCRLVIIIGIPYANMGDDKVKLKREYLTQNVSKGYSSINGNTWYEQDAVMAVNQAIGRVIRHIFDYGAIIAFDSRHKDLNARKLFSKWLIGKVKVQGSFNANYVNELSDFYKKAKEFTDSEILKNNLMQIDQPQRDTNGNNAGGNNMGNNPSMNNNWNGRSEDSESEPNGEFEFKPVYANKGQQIQRSSNAFPGNKTGGNKRPGNKPKNQKGNPIRKQKGNNNPFPNANQTTLDNNLIGFVSLAPQQNKERKDNKFSSVFNSSVSNTSMENNRPKKEEKKEAFGGLTDDFFLLPADDEEEDKKQKENKKNPFLNSTNTDSSSMNSGNRRTFDRNEYSDLSNNDDFMSRESGDNIKKKLQSMLDKAKGILNKCGDKTMIPQENPFVLGNNGNSERKGNDSNKKGFETNREECPICYKKRTEQNKGEFSIAKCEHMLCNNCWNSWLSSKLECPICKKKVRQKTLRKLE